MLVEPCDQLAASDVGVYEVEGAIKLRDAAHMPEGAGATGWAERGGNGGELARLLGAARALFRNFPKS